MFLFFFSVLKDASSFNQTWCSTKWLNAPLSSADIAGAIKVNRLCCRPGQFFNKFKDKCELCDFGQYNNLTDVTNTLPTSCKVCPRNTFAPIQGMPECSRCAPLQYR